MIKLVSQYEVEEAEMFCDTATGYYVTDETIKFWKSRESCPSCGSIEPPTMTKGHVNTYQCSVESDVTWTHEQ